MEALTPREKDVLELLAKGYSYKGIAAELVLSSTTITTHVHNIYDKFGFRHIGRDMCPRVLTVLRYLQGDLPSAVLQ